MRGCLRCLLLMMCTHPFAKKALTLHLARSEGHERYFSCNLTHRKVLASFYQHLMAEAPVEFLKELLNLARDVVSADRTAPPMEREAQGKAALTELFEEARNPDTPIIVERVVTDIDEIVRYVRFDGWQSTHAGEREVKLALRKMLFKYKLHQDQELFNRAYGYIREFY